MGRGTCTGVRLGHRRAHQDGREGGREEEGGGGGGGIYSNASLLLPMYIHVHVVAMRSLDSMNPARANAVQVSHCNYYLHTNVLVP